MSRTFTVNADSTAVMASRGREYPLRQCKPRASTSCANCRRFIASGTIAYVETAAARDRYWLSGAKVCAACVTGGSR